MSSVMELEPEIVQIQDLSSNANVFAENANGTERRWEDCEGQPSHSSSVV